jgi:murein DD-endopeptidase MepM/ murein hydrolase activator NlpD
MVDSFEGSFQQLIGKLRSLFNSEKSQPAPATPGPGQAQTQFIEPSGSYKAPIHGQWYNLGGFDLGMVRYDDPKGAKKGRGHKGVDMSASAGTPIYPMAPGVVTQVSTTKIGGNNVSIKHSNTLSTYYAHMATISVHPGDKVDTNTIIGTVGNSGNAGDMDNPSVTTENGRTFPHLHFEVHSSRTAVDPAKYFSIPAYNREYASNPKKYLSFWTNEQAKQQAQSFNMKDHMSKQRVAFSRDVDALMKISFEYAKLTRGLNDRPK